MIEFSAKRYSPQRIAGFKQAVSDAKPSNLPDLYLGWKFAEINDDYDRGYYAGLVFSGLTSEIQAQIDKEYGE